ncbi:MAG: peptidoglycan editing factor PgeF, partial [Nocardioidaceae bacterium]
DEVAENVRLAARALTGAEPPVLRMRQVHGSDVHVVVSVDDAVPVADAMVTARPGVVLMVRVADCVPVVLADAGRGIVGVAHAGRPGMAAGVVPNTVAAMRDLGAADLVAWVGPHVCGRCYEVPAEMRAEVSALVPEAYAETSWGTAALDIGAGVRAQLRSAGVAVVDAARCTVEDEDLYSYRRQGKQSGRMAGLVWARP